MKCVMKGCERYQSFQTEHCRHAEEGTKKGNTQRDIWHELWRLAPKRRGVSDSTAFSDPLSTPTPLPPRDAALAQQAIQPLSPSTHLLDAIGENWQVDPEQADTTYFPRSTTLKPFDSSSPVGLLRRRVSSLESLASSLLQQARSPMPRRTEMLHDFYNATMEHSPPAVNQAQDDIGKLQNRVRELYRLAGRLWAYIGAPSETNGSETAILFAWASGALGEPESSARPTPNIPQVASQPSNAQHNASPIPWNGSAEPDPVLFDHFPYSETEQVSYPFWPNNDSQFDYPLAFGSTNLGISFDSGLGNSFPGSIDPSLIASAPAGPSTRLPAPDAYMHTYGDSSAAPRREEQMLSKRTRQEDSAYDTGTGAADYLP